MTDEARTLFSLPGEWIDRHGRSRPRFPIRRILVIKADHIGDLLIADAAIVLLRQFFPDARLELVCGTWNVGLARRLGRFDAVHGVDLFHELSGEQSNEAIAQEMRRKGAEALARLALGPFDLAVDLRYDPDTRSALLNVDARVYAGFGRFSKFPFLDIIVPRHEDGSAEGASEVVLSGADFASREAGGTPLRAAGRNVAEISARRSEILLGFHIEGGAASPKDCSTGNDLRQLGIGVEMVTIEGRTFADTPEGTRLLLSPSFDDGWHGAEGWGAWSADARAFLSLVLPPDFAAPFVRIGLTLRAHVNAVNQIVRCTIATGAEGEEVAAEFEHGRRERVTVPLIVAAQRPQVSLVSKPVDLVPGRYAGSLRLYLPDALRRAALIALSLCDAAGSARLMRRGWRLDRATRGIVNLPFACTVEPEKGPLIVELETGDAHLLPGARIEYLSLTAEERFKVSVPVAHMTDWSSLLVLRIAQIFSDEAPFGRAAAGATAELRELPPGVAMPAGVGAVRDRLERWRAEGDAVVGIAIGCNTAIRKWPFVHFIELAVELLRLERVKVVFVGGPADQDEAMVACTELGLDPALHALCGATRLEDLGLVLALLDLFIGNNTGTTHYAGKVGVRTIGIYAGTNHPREWGPIGENASWMYRDEPCAPCHLTDLADCKRWHACMVQILPPDVLALAVPELAAVRSRRQPVRATASVERPLMPRAIEPEPVAAAEEHARLRNPVRRKPRRPAKSRVQALADVSRNVRGNATS